VTRPRLLFLSLSSRQFGGGEAYLLNLLDHFRLKSDVFIACARENPLMIQRVTQRGLPVLELSLGYRHLVANTRSLAAWHAQEGFHLVHANGRRSQLFGALLSRRTGLPLVGADLVANLNWEGSAAGIVQNLLAALLNRLLVVPRCDRILVLCEHMRRESLRWLRVPPDRLVTVYNAVDPDFFAPQARDEALAESLGIPPQVPVIGCVARFVSHKGQRTLIEATARLARNSPARVLLVGDGPDEADLRRQIREQGLEDRFVLTGFPADLRPYLALMDVVVLPSRSEGLPTALLQAMSMERPVIGTDIQGIPELIRPGENGFLFPPGRIDLLESHLKSLLEDPQASRRMGRAGRERVLSTFSLPVMLEKIETIYREVLSSRDRPH